MVQISEKLKDHYFTAVGERGVGIVSQLILNLDKKTDQNENFPNFFLVALSGKEKDTIVESIDRVIHPTQISEAIFDGTDVWSDYPENESLITEKIVKPYFKWLDLETNNNFQDKISIFMIASLYSGTSQGIIHFLYEKIRIKYPNAEVFGIFVFPTSIENTGPVEIYNALLALESIIHFDGAMFIDYPELGKKFKANNYSRGDFGDLDGKTSIILQTMLRSFTPISSLFLSMQVYDRLNLFSVFSAQPGEDFIPERGKKFTEWLPHLNSILFSERNDEDFPIARNCIIVGGAHDFGYVDKALKQLSSEMDEHFYFSIPPMQMSLSQVNDSNWGEVLLLENSTSIFTCKFKQLYMRFAKMYERKVFFHIFTQCFDNPEEKLACAASSLKVILDGYKELFW